MQTEITSSDRATFYLAALRLLRFAERRSPTQRRFGTDADALWKDFAGELKTSDRVDILLRDADTEWPGAFGARATFGLRAVAEDDAFGADWASLAPMDGERVWKDGFKGDVADSVGAALEGLCAAWELTPSPFELPKLTPTSRAVVGGASAIAAAIATFAESSDLRWTEQIIVVADAPGERQLAASAAVLLNTTAGTVLRASSDHREEGAKPGSRSHSSIVSPDAPDEIRRAVEELAK